VSVANFFLNRSRFRERPDLKEVQYFIRFQILTEKTRCALFAEEALWNAMQLRYRLKITLKFGTI
jgi:NifU-like protein involved in Fe-S cluster formation